MTKQQENQLWIKRRTYEIAKTLKSTGQNPNWRSGQQMAYARGKARREFLETLDSGDSGINQ